MALLRQRQEQVATSLGPHSLKRSPQLQGGSLCQRCGNTNPSWAQTSRPSSWQSHHHHQAVKVAARGCLHQKVEEQNLGFHAGSRCAGTHALATTTAAVTYRPCKLASNSTSCKVLPMARTRGATSVSDHVFHIKVSGAPHKGFYD